MAPKPFLKWAGGKRYLLPEIMSRLPEDFDHYVEPFVGGGSVVFGLHESLKARGRYRRMISDTNATLIDAYRVVADYLDLLLPHLQAHRERHADTSYYYEVRDQYNEDAQQIIHPKTWNMKVLQVGRFIYLNKTGFNGLFRTNRRGEFNVPRGSYKDFVYNGCELEATSAYLQDTVIIQADYKGLEALPGAFIYCDPPYDGVTYAMYGKDVFGQYDQHRLQHKMLDWHEQGAKVMLSNADTEFIRWLYGSEPFIIHEVENLRSISRDGASRGAVTELLITNYT